MTLIVSVTTQSGRWGTTCGAREEEDGGGVRGRVNEGRLVGGGVCVGGGVLPYKLKLVMRNCGLELKTETLKRVGG